MVVPNEHDRVVVHRIIYEELVAERSRRLARWLGSSHLRLVANGAEAVILGWPEIVLLVKPEDSPVTLFDTTALHARAAIAMALDG